MVVEPLPNPYMRVDDAKGDFDAFVDRIHNAIIDDVMEFADHFTNRSRPELAEFMRQVMLTDNTGGNIDALEQTAEYEQFYATMSMVSAAFADALAAKFRPNIYGSIQYRIAQRERALVGAP